MNNANEIERMAKILHQCSTEKLKETDEGFVCVYPSKQEIAIALADAGIGDKKQAVKEFADELDTRAQDLKGDGWDEYNDGFKRGVRETLSLMYDLISELYGDNEGGQA